MDQILWEEMRFNHQNGVGAINDSPSPWTNKLILRIVTSLLTWNFSDRESSVNAACRNQLSVSNAGGQSRYGMKNIAHTTEEADVTHNADEEIKNTISHFLASDMFLGSSSGSSATLY